MPVVVAVKFDPSVPLQILAGPGSGKTKVCEDFSSPQIRSSYKSGPHIPHRALDCFAQALALLYMRPLRSLTKQPTKCVNGLRLRGSSENREQVPCKWEHFIHSVLDFCERTRGM